MTKYSLTLKEGMEIRFSSKDEKNEYTKNERIALDKAWKQWWSAEPINREPTRIMLEKAMIKHAKKEGYTKKAKDNGVTTFSKAIKAIQ